MPIRRVIDLPMPLDERTSARMRRISTPCRSSASSGAAWSST
jgi:hypothetical protein